MKLILVLAVAVAAGLLARPAPAPAPGDGAAEYRIVNRYPADPAAFTQGLLYQHDDRLLVSTGLYGASSLRLVEVTTGRILARHALEPHLFGEGITRIGDEIVQLTWREGVALRYDAATLAPRGRWQYEGEGWGLTFWGGNLVMSDGSDELSLRDPASFAEHGRVSVRYRGRPQRGLNALQAVEDRIYANVWPGSEIVRIEMPGGTISGRLDLAVLVAQVEASAGQPIDVLNGIAYDAQRGRVFIGGKLWPWLFEIDSPFFRSEAPAD
jgi:glutaminyl-peptide cyclotransferase